MIPGVKIVMGSGSGPMQTVYYFRSDVSNSGLQASGFLKFAATLGNGNGLIKSASYLMHSGNFSQIRDFVLGHSQYIVQDDSGIPLAAFSPETWSFRRTAPISARSPSSPDAASRGLASCSRKRRRRRSSSASATATAGTTRTCCLRCARIS